MASKKKRAGAAATRSRSTKARAPRVRLDNQAPGITVSHRDGRTRVQIHSELRRVGKGLVAPSTRALVGQLYSELHAVMEYGNDGREDKLEASLKRLDPVLKVYAEIWQSDDAKTLAFALAMRAWLVVVGDVSPALALEQTKAARGQASWRAPDGSEIDESHVVPRARRERGPAPDPLVDAERIYRALAWDSRAYVEPKARASPEVKELLKRARRNHELHVIFWRRQQEREGVDSARTETAPKSRDNKHRA